ncbi:o-succinylbenzoate synthase [Echinicola sp. CAU 1574]|uniref:O-succinylbenzoate synthase n=1 Tax=Echinicola arenosa TaxID=2774144 RepID=A0ABR9APW8_9BACT|nr:o-succinylbenzoate synthase [Echinicola arenosa]MBD8490822.1 o-succinylbenzoate synthase [Echinicola arenosa]
MNKKPDNTVKVNAKYLRHTLDFKFDAGTSRGVLRTKDSFFIKVTFPGDSKMEGWGEAGPLPKLSIDDVPNFENILKAYVNGLSEKEIDWSEAGILEFCKTYVMDAHPSIRFAFEMALLDLFHGGKRQILENDFYRQHMPIPINGLIWMGDESFMLKQIEEKLELGFSCIKMKIGAIDFKQECRLLGFIRERFTAEQITLRVDANGAFSPHEAMDKLERLAEFDLHSIEQPIKAGQWDELKRLCKESPLDIALDEELIGIYAKEDRKKLLEHINPQYIILKPTLVGGIRDTREWIWLAENMGVGWWMTSALESNIGLNAISQLTASYDIYMPQGLGTGQLYKNNVASPLEIVSGNILYNPSTDWGKI